MKSIRRWYRACKAAWFPFAFARWLNRERCYVTIHNDPSGQWTVRIGLLDERHDKTIGKAMCLAFWMAEEHTPGWQWTSDWLRENFKN